MKVVNFFAGPGVGKSTLAAAVFVELKKWGVNAELVSEYAKQLVYDNRLDVLENDQIYVLAKQNRKLKILQKSNLDYAVVDSPLLLSCVYNNSVKPRLFNPLVLSLAKEYDNINFYIQRDKTRPYAQNGRIHTLEEAKKLDRKIEKFLENQ